MPGVIEQEVYFITPEVLVNTAKHGHTSTVRLDVELANDLIGGPP
jgi:signal transduction histidine kinase